MSYFIRANSTNGQLNNKNHTYFLYGNNAKNIAEREYAKFEGDMIHYYEPTTQLNLLDMSDPQSVTLLLSYANNIERNGIEQSFQLRNNKVLRKSKKEYDTIVSKLLCKLGYDGYYTPRMQTIYSYGTFHPEVMLCNPKQKVKFIKSEYPNKPLKPKPQNRTTPVLPTTFRNLGLNL